MEEPNVIQSGKAIRCAHKTEEKSMLELQDAYSTIVNTHRDHSLLDHAIAEKSFVLHTFFFFKHQSKFNFLLLSSDKWLGFSFVNKKTIMYLLKYNIYIVRFIHSFLLVHGELAAKEVLVRYRVQTYRKYTFLFKRTNVTSGIVTGASPVIPCR